MHIELELDCGPCLLRSLRREDLPSLARHANNPNVAACLLGYWLGESFWGRGIATTAIRCFTHWAMPRFELTRVYAEVFDANPASVRVLEKAGFHYVGLLRKAAIKRGAYHDYRLYDLVR